MAPVQIFTVDAFTTTPTTRFRGNTCAVCILCAWPDDALLQSIAAQNLYAETAFIVPQADAPELRWFTVSQEVDFCGYGTLSAGYVYMKHIAPGTTRVIFSTRRYGRLPVEQKEEMYQIEVPVKPPTEEAFQESVYAALGGTCPVTMHKTARGDLLVVYATSTEVTAITPDFPQLMATGFYGYVLTAPGENGPDYVYRYFSPRMTNVWEDPVNGASHSALAPYWTERVGKTLVRAHAASARGGDVYCAYEGGATVKIGGYVSLYLQGEIFVT